MSDLRKPRGPLAHRVLIGFFTILLAILSYWLLDFVMDDIVQLKAPAYEDVEARVVDKSLLDQDKNLNQQEARINAQRSELSQQQEALRESTNSSKETMNQLLEIQKLELQKGTKASDEESRALAESKQLF